ncbi:MAG: serine/threonine-protein kinase [Thermoguttaceae bacterium]|jgi:serine/threonine protein kinase
MAWPLPSHFQASLQNPRIAFRDPELRSCSFEENALGQPRPWAGNFAVVYKGTGADGTSRAVRVFSTESPQRRERYDCVAEYLTARKLPCLVNFEYRDDAIRCLADGRWYPLILMDWVAGQTLFDWVHAQYKANAQTLLTKGAMRWVDLVGELSEAQIAHGDLQHANVLVTPDSYLKLVDYDGICVPALAGQRNLEKGTPPYQHPARNGDTPLSPRLDNFSALLIYVALRALAADPRLWNRHVGSEYDKLLFREDDFRQPDRSALRRDLQDSPDPHVREMAELLFASAAGDIDQVPSLIDLAAERHEVLACPAPPATALTSEAAAQPPPIGDVAGETDGTRWQETEERPPDRPAPAIKGYKIGNRLGSGILGSVYKAMFVDSGKPVAVKIVTPKVGATEYHRRRFLREMDHIVRLQHPNIAAVLKCGAIGKDLYFVTEYCGGGSLSQWMRSRGRLSLAYARPLMRECLDALQYAHLHQVIHDDLKPQNILWDLSSGPPVVKISDFGLARNLAAAGLSGTATAGARRAENCYTPRERLTSDHQSRPVSDLWSLAAVFYHALSGQLPYDFGSRDPVEVILTEDPVPLGDRDGSIPVGLAGVIDRALKTNPAHRYQTAVKMKAGLEQAFW